ncbi:short chain dehydrogenase [Sediminibacillus albus]|uniref:NAD(P)-dependent dehydrogenase, short-chain alcohol dehydrogenase family n=1 Tax=Sediminibacillus albus TaxID=407036 RepID=A0A1G9BDD4_9BACI|nr:short chain dehydrogenase [Sediminibacillus albus]SDK37493.1 NAD(P)-dependent dehydrogenase, short-chain alcohol dehydrogenase family [Sediminibacillus albus]
MKVLLIGGTGTIGKSVADKLKTNHEVIIASKSTGDYKVDITSSDSIEQMYKDLSNMDAVISTTGASHFGHLSELTPELNEIAIDSKLKGQVNLVLIGQKYINEGGSFTLTTGIMMDDPILRGSSAAMANGAVASFVKSAAIELKRNIRINTVSPTVLEESLGKYGEFFKGFNPVPAAKVANAYVKSVEGAQTGQVYQVY